MVLAVSRDRHAADAADPVSDSLITCTKSDHLRRHLQVCHFRTNLTGAPRHSVHLVSGARNMNEMNDLLKEGERNPPSVIGTADGSSHRAIDDHIEAQGA
jgi:hypothetical protein